MGVRGARISKPLQVVLLAGIALVLIVLRRPDQFLQPAVWAEDGLGLSAIAAHGIGSLLVPVNGYFIVLPKLILYLSARISLLYLPAISLAFTTVVIVGTVLAIAFSPTIVEWRWLCALAVLLVPTNPEVFSVGLYTLWWANLLTLLVVLWRPSRPSFYTRAGFLLLGGLSAPVVVGLLPFFLWRSVAFRRWQERVLAGMAIALSLFQLWPILGSDQPSYLFKHPGWVFFYGIRDMLGWYVAALWPGNDLRKFILGALIGVWLLYLAVRYARERAQHRDKLTYFPLLAAFAIFSVLSVSRVEAWAIHPVLSGPRYFFYPFVLLSWLLIWIAAREPRWPRWVALGLLALATTQTLRAFSRHHDPFHWTAQVARCVVLPQAGMDILTDGRSTSLWHVGLNRQQCRQMIDASLFGWLAIGSDAGLHHGGLGRFDPGQLVTQSQNANGFEAIPVGSLHSPIPNVPVTMGGKWTVNGYFPSAPALPLKATAYGSWSGSDANVGVLRFGPFPGAGRADLAVPVMTGPDSRHLSLRLIDATTKRTAINLSSLPAFPSQRWLVWHVAIPAAIRNDSLLIEAEDAGRGWGQWFAVAPPFAMNASKP